MISLIKAQFELQTKLFLDVLSSIVDSESNQKIADHLNSVKWVAGHVLNTRLTLLGILANEIPDPEMSKYFGKGTSGLIHEEMPNIKLIIENWKVVSTRLLATLEQLNEEALSSPPPFQTSIPNKTLGGLIAFMALHEGHHLGQISILRRSHSADNVFKITNYDKVICN